MQAVTVLMACMVCASYARRVRSGERMESYADFNPVTSFAYRLRAYTPAGAFAPVVRGKNVLGGRTHAVSLPALLESRQRHLGRIDMLVGKKEKMTGESEDTGPKDVYVSRMNDNLAGDVIDVQFSELKPERKSFTEETDYDVVIVGAGPSGIGMALMLTRNFNLDPSKVLVIEQGKNVGESFRRWPKEMRFISPSFNQAGWTSSFDLNAVSFDTSIAYLFRTEHPTGKEYAAYLKMIVKAGELNVQLETRVTNIRDMGKKGKIEGREPGPFLVEVIKGGVTQNMSTRYVVWAAGEYQHPKIASKLFPGSELCLHNTRVQSWAALPGDEFVIIGGYESGMDAAINLAKLGKNCKVLASTPFWNIQTGEPSTELAPYTVSRLREVQSASLTPTPKLFAPLRVIAVEEAEGGGYNVTARWKDVQEKTDIATYPRFEVEETGEKDSIVTFHTKHPPILCTGFEGSVAAQASHLFEFPDPDSENKGCIGNGPLLTRSDESTKTPGAFLVGPSVTHGKLSFCFVYKFRQRLAVVANAICQGLGMETAEAVAECRQYGMYLDDFATCEGVCGDAC